ncbi:MAG: energy transducer TonB [Bryobacteraceae bacterium]|jgi:TonB family protein
MFTKLAAAAALAALLVTLAPAQTAAELLQKGIYTQQTAGDVDAAIQIYRQVIATSGDQRALAGQAQMQIVGAMLQKGDLVGASQEFSTLVTDYADQKALIASVAARMGGGSSVVGGGPLRLPLPPGVYRVGNGVTAPRVLYKKEPEYSVEARLAKLSGTVVLSVEVGPDGLAHNIQVVRSLGMGLDEKAIEAAGAWRFEPGKKDGAPVTVQVAIEVNFRF